MTSPTFVALSRELVKAFRFVHPSERYYAVFGTGVMYLHGIREELGDVDLFVTKELYEALRDHRGWEEREAEHRPPNLELALPGVPPFHATWQWADQGVWTPDIDAIIHWDHDLVQGWPCQKLGQLARWYQHLDRKDRGDAQKAFEIGEYLLRKNACAN